jgi:hypothetical protein
LIGELLFLERLIAQVGPASAMTAWLGPGGAPQDFQTGGQLYEIKVCPIGAHIVVISSLEQLHTANTPTTLVVFSIGSSSVEQSGAFTPNGIVSRIRQSLADDSAASSNFELKLAEVGFDETQPECEEGFLVDTVRAFAVRESFPRLTPASVPRAISSATYSLDLDRCNEFEIPFSRVLET